MVEMCRNCCQGFVFIIHINNKAAFQQERNRREQFALFPQPKTDQTALRWAPSQTTSGPGSGAVYLLDVVQGLRGKNNNNLVMFNQVLTCLVFCENGKGLRRPIELAY